MGEYEPEDSRDVTLNPSTTPGEPPRTGPREGESRERNEKPVPRDQQPDPTVRQGEQVQQPQQKGVQMQSQSQSQSQSGTAPKQSASESTGKGDGLNSDIESGPLAGDQPQAIDNPVGDARPNYDQYELNSPETMHQDADEEARRRAQAEGQNDSSLANGLGYTTSAQQRREEERGYGADGEERLEKLDGDDEE